MPSRTLIIRADASVEMGTGHVIRCLALAQAWQDKGGDASFAMAQSTPALDEYLRSEHVVVENLAVSPGGEQDALQLVLMARGCAADWVVVDGYQFDSAYQRAIKRAGLKLLLVDDTGESGPHSADIILNQNPHANHDMYRGSNEYPRLLLGLRFAMVRRQFAAWREWKRAIVSVGNKILVTMGGSDAANITKEIIHALHLVQVPFEAKVILGGSNPHGEILEKAVGMSSNKIELIRNPSDIPDLMAWAEMGIAAAGSVCWEICLLGLPAILIDVAENQHPIAQELGRQRAVIHLSSSENFVPRNLASAVESLLSSSEVRSTISEQAKKLVDGKGAERVIAGILAGNLRLRRAEDADCRLLWQWANDPETRAASFSSGPISWEQHKAWFRHKQNDPDCRILVGEDANGRLVGQFRVDWRSDGEGEIDVSISPDCRGFGYGNLLIELGTRRAFSETKGQRLHAFVKPDNQASRRTFERAGFSRVGEEKVNGQQAVHYVRAREQGQR